jgi:hypothetical protein
MLFYFDLDLILFYSSLYFVMMLILIYSILILFYFNLHPKILFLLLLILSVFILSFFLVFDLWFIGRLDLKIISILILKSS